MTFLSADKTLKITVDGEEIYTFGLNDERLFGRTPESMQKIFKVPVRPYYPSFTRVEEQKNRNIEGTGLRLSLTKNLVELMGGKIYVTSEYGKGSVFSAAIPQQVVNFEPLGDFTQKYQQFIHLAEMNNHILSAPKAKILVVDDVEMNLKVAQGYLKQTLHKLSKKNGISIIIVKGGGYSPEYDCKG